MDSPRSDPIRKVCCYSVAVVFIIIFSLSFQVIPPATVGVTVMLGSVGDKTLQSGLNIVPPWMGVVRFSTKRDVLDQTLSVPTSEGLNVVLEVAVLYHLDKKRVHELYLHYGTDFLRRMMVPTISSVVRSATSSADAKSLYTASRAGVQTQMSNELKAAFAPVGIILDNVPAPEGITQIAPSRARL